MGNRPGNRPRQQQQPAAPPHPDHCHYVCLDTSNHGEYDCYQTACGMEACHVAFDASVPFPPPVETAGERRCVGCGKLRGIQSARRPLFADWCCGRGSYSGNTAELPPNPRPAGERTYPPDEDAVCKPTKACKPAGSHGTIDDE